MIDEAFKASPLPSSWPLVRLRNVASVRYGKALASDIRVENGKVPVYGSSTTTRLHDIAYHHKPSIVIGRKGSVGSVQYVNVPFWPIDTVFFLDDVSPLVDLRFLAAALSYFGLDRYKIVVGVPGLNRGDLEKFQFPLPPLSEQQWIVDILQEAKEVLRLRIQAEIKTAELVPAIFSKFFGDGTGRFQNVPMRELVAEFKYGTSRSSSERGATTLRIPNVLDDRISFDNLARVDESDEALERLRLKTGDMLFVRTNGNPDYVGRCCVFDEADAERETGEGSSIIFASYLIRARFKPKIIRPWFLHAYLCSSLGRARVLKQARTAAGQYNINTEGLGAIRIPVPPVELQDRFLLQSAETQHITEIIRRTEKEAIALEKSLFAHAFSGQLTTVWREANKKKLAKETRQRDDELAIAVGKSILVNFSNADSHEEAELFDLPADLSREQIPLLFEIRRLKMKQELPRYFTAEFLAELVKGPLHRHPQAIETHLRVFAVRGLVIPVSRARNDEPGRPFAASYRLPISEQTTPEDITDDVKADRMKQQRDFATKTL